MLVPCLQDTGDDRPGPRRAEHQRQAGPDVERKVAIAEQAIAMIALLNVLAVRPARTAIAAADSVACPACASVAAEIAADCESANPARWFR